MIKFFSKLIIYANIVKDIHYEEAQLWRMRMLFQNILLNRL